jgi:hypothetical protein
LTVLPALALLGAIFFNTIIHWLKQTKGSIEANGVLIIAVLWSIHAFFMQPNYYFNPSVKEISHSFSPGNPFPEHQQLSEYLQRIIKPTDRLMVFGSDPQYFIYLNKTSPIRHVYMPFFASRDYPRALKWQQETVEGLKSTSPEYVVFNNYAMAWMYKPSENAQMYAQIYNYLSLQYDIVAFIENPGKTTLSSIKIQEPTSTKKGPSTDIYIVVYKRR